MLWMGAALVLPSLAEKVWNLTLPADPADITNKAAVVVSDGNYELNAYIRNATSKTLTLGTVDTKSALRKDENGTYIGSGDLDMRGPIHVDGAASEWKFTRIETAAFSITSVPFDNVYLPTTLLDMAGGTFQNCGSTAGLNGEFVLEAPEMTGDLPNNTFLVWGKPKVLKLNIPKVTCLGGYWNKSDYVDFICNTDVSDWNLESVRLIATIGSKTKTDPAWLLRYTKFRGTMHLPGLKWLNPMSFYCCPNMNGLEAGRNGTLEYVGQNAAANCTALGDVTLGGVAAGFTVSTNAFYSANISNVTFLTSQPIFEENESVVFGTESTPALQIAFHIPAKTSLYWEKWWPVRLSARAPSTAERAAFASQRGEAEAARLVGIVPKEVFHTQNEQWLVEGVPDGSGQFRLKVALDDPRFTGDSVSVSPEPNAYGYYTAGTLVTLTAHADEAEGLFGRWRADGFGEDRETLSTVTIRMDRDWNIVAQFNHDWTLRLNDPEATTVTDNVYGTISNRVWKLNVKVVSASQGTLKFGKGTNGGGWTDFGEGPLNMNGRIFWKRGEADEKTFIPTGTEGNALLLDANGAYIAKTRYPRSLIFAETLRENVGQAFRNYTRDYPVTNLVMICPNYPVAIYTDSFCNYNLVSALFRVPKLIRPPNDYTHVNLQASVDVSDWRLDSVSTMIGAAAGAWGTYTGIFRDGKYTGTLHLPMYADVVTNSFENASNLLACELGTNTVMKKIGEKAFNGCTSLTRLRLGELDPAFTVSGNSFVNTTSLKLLEFGASKPPDDPSTLDNLLDGTTLEVAANPEPPVMVVSWRLGWTPEKVSSLKPPTDAELAAKPLYLKNRRILGVWQTASGARKAWVIHQPTDKDPKNTILLFR